MTPAFYEIKIWRGSTRDLEFRFPLDLTGYTANIIYKMGGHNFTIPLTLQLYSSDPLYWSATATLSKAYTLALPEGRKITYELVLTIGARDVAYLYGNLFIEGSNSGS